MKDEYDRAIDDYDTAIGLDANDAYSYYSRGWAYLLLHDVPRARADLDKALELGHDKDDIAAALATLKSLEENG